MSARPDIDWLLGATDETFGVQVWIARIENLKAHFSLIQSCLPNDNAWLINQVGAAMAEADRYIASAIPADDKAEELAA
ncbi:hypothetical protein [Sphingopyxis witflariensis]|uniref:Uncharacterized protein n=1 Tax=Sphingopyxis witflariensis TaxID=173675 RepID=A0A246JY21_9SPHN|nr:hypothetical protein [Sphingopyxis witflariensis]OWQ97993.1 hypothetical protein CDQ91_10255 [Sphingopyxis witflariensis]